MRYNITQLKLGQNKDTICCVSGGCDSIACAHYLKNKIGLHTIYHFNHGTKLAPAMEEKVVRFARDFGFTLIVARTGEELKSEEDFRKARFKFIEDSGRDFISGANLDDANEGHFMRFIEGKPDYMPIPLVTVLKSAGKMFHPFLTTEKKEFRNYIKIHNLGDYVCEDMTNHDPNSGRRAWVRNFVIPEMVKKGIHTKRRVKNMILEKYKTLEIFS